MTTIDTFKHCHFPFKETADAPLRHSCLYGTNSKGRPYGWCATKVDENGVRSYAQWGYCSDECKTQEEAMLEVEPLIQDSWRKDETLKVTIQYDNSALWTAVNLYGNILPFLVLYSMGLSILLPALGKTC